MRRFLLPAAVVFFVAASMHDPIVEADERQSMKRFTSITDHIALNPSPNDWLMWRGTYNSWGYSPLDQINTRNVRQLQLAWA